MDTMTFGGVPKSGSFTTTATAGLSPPTSPPAITANSDRTTTHSDRGLFMVGSSFSRSPSEGGRENFVRGLEDHALRPRDRCRQRSHERRALVVDLPPQQHREVLVRGVVAVLHEHPGEVPELQRDRDVAARPESPDVLPAPLRRRHVARLAVTGEGLALLEVDVDG